MIRSLYTAATGMKANQLYIDNIANNLSNVNTTGFKKSKLEFQDLLYQTMVEPGSGNADGAKAPAGLQVGLGTRSVSNQKIFGQGSLQQTTNNLDIAIQGSGFIQVQMPNGETAYSRDGSLKISSDGTLVTSNGYLIEPNITIPDGAQQLTIDGNGKVAVIMNNSGTFEDVGQIELAKFVNEGGLKSLGNNLYQATAASGQPEIEVPGENGTGAIMQGYLEASNVEMVEEMVNMIVAQRAYEVSSKAIKTAEEMLQIANQLKG